jgi:hypothetical protein
MTPDNEQGGSPAEPVPVPAPESTPAAEPIRRSYEDWATDKIPEAWALAAAKTLMSWPVGREVTEAEFDEAIRTAKAIQIGY